MNVSRIMFPFRWASYFVKYRIVPALLLSAMLVSGCGDLVAGLESWLLEKSKEEISDQYASEAKIIAAFDGVWIGEGELTEWVGREGKVSDSKLSIRITIVASEFTQSSTEGTRFKIEYPSLECGGTVNVIKFDENQLNFFEEPTIVNGNCLGEGYTEITRTGEHTVSFTKQRNGAGKSATAELTRQR